MDWMPKVRRRESQKNGTITIFRNLFDRWQVSVNDCGQTTRYTHAMWIKAFKGLRARLGKKQITSVLMLGLGAGGEIATIHKNFPNCKITVVEYDPEMVALTKELGLYKPYPFPDVLLGDARDVVPTITERFDLVILDLFLGPEPSPLGGDAAFMQKLRDCVAQGGALIHNVYRRAEYLNVGEALFPHAELWRFRLNNLGTFYT